MPDSAYIPDGYTKCGRIKPQAGLHPQVRFKYRPATAQQHETIMGVLRSRDDGGKFTAEVIAKHVLEWDIPGIKGDTLEINTNNVLHLAPSVFSKLFTIVVGLAPSDELDDESDPFSGGITYAAKLAEITEAEAEVKN